MAINRDKKSNSDLPEKLAEMLKAGFSFQQVKAVYDKAFNATKAEVIKYLKENQDGFSCDLSAGFKCDQGTVIYKELESTEIDRDKLLDEMQKNPSLVASVVISGISTFKKDELEKILGSALYGKITKVETGKPSLTMSATPEFKEECAEKFGKDIEIPTFEVANKKFKKEEKPKKSEVASSVAKLKAAKGKAKPQKNADDELDDILGDKS
jgi:hypothetical protein